MKMMRYVLSVLVVLSVSQAWSQKGGSDIGSSNLDTFFRAGDEVKEIEMKTLGNAQSDAGALVQVYACVSSTIATADLQNQLEQQFKADLLAAFKSVPLGQKIIDKILEEDSNALDLNLEKRSYAQACEKQIATARADQRISSEVLAKILRLSEVAGQVLGQHMTSAD